MGPSRTFTITKTKEKNVYSRVADLYCINRTKKHVWLQRIAIWVLDKLGCHHYENNIAYERIQIDSGKFMNDLMEQCKEVRNCLHHHPKMVYIGAPQMEEWFACNHVGSVMKFNVTYDYYDQYTGPKLYGMNVVVVPWLDGVFIPPSD